jgi:uncharacterized membrane protein required for colicin V production
VTYLIKQLIILVVVACILSVILNSVGIGYIVGFLLGIVIQYALYNAYIYAVDAYTILKAKKIEHAKIQEYSQQGMEVTCPCANKNKEFVPIRLNKPNYYKCQMCKKVVGAFVGIETAVITEPVAETDLTSIEKLIETKLNEHTR